MAYDFTKTYANKKGLVAALRKENINLDKVQLEDIKGRWCVTYIDADYEAQLKGHTDAFEMAKEELAAQEGRPSNVTYDLTDNEFHAACVLVRSCFQGMGGSHPLDLEKDEYTWVNTKDLIALGWSMESAAGTFASLDHKGVIFDYEDGKGVWVLETRAWKWLATVWDDKARALSVTHKEHVGADKEDAPVKKTPDAPKPGKKTETIRQNGVRFPRVGGACHKAWMLFDELYKANNAFTVKDALAEGYVRDLNDGNVRTELCLWRKFHGVASTRAAKKN
jgi:hypothetical protein